MSTGPIPSRRPPDIGPTRVFLASRGPRLPLAPFSLITLVDRLGRRAGVKHAHCFRHIFATWALENQARELDVQYLLGHSTSAMVRCHSATYDAARAVEAHRAFSPVERRPNAERSRAVGRLQVEGPVRPVAVVEGHVLAEETAEVRFAEDDHVVQTFAARRANHPFDDGVRRSTPASRRCAADRSRLQSRLRSNAPVVVARS